MFFWEDPVLCGTKGQSLTVFRQKELDLPTVHLELIIGENGVEPTTFLLFVVPFLFGNVSCANQDTLDCK